MLTNAAMTTDSRNAYNNANDNAPITHGQIHRHTLAHPVAKSTHTLWQGAQKTGGIIEVSAFSPVKPGIRITRPVRSLVKTTNPHQAGLPTPTPTRPTSFQPKPDTPRPTSSGTQPKKTGKKLVFLASLVLLALTFAFLTTPLSLVWKLAGGIDLTLSGLLLTRFAHKKQAKIAHAIGLCIASYGCAQALWSGLRVFEIANQAEIFVLILGALALGMARLSKTPYFLNLSALMMLGWAGLGFAQGGPTQLAWLFPALWSLQIFLALEFNRKRCLFLTIMCGIIWIGAQILIFQAHA